jgi:hypothetical protein
MSPLLTVKERAYVDTVYSKAEIRAFCQGNLTFSCPEFELKQGHKIRTTMAAEIEALPADQQLIMIHGYHHNEVRPRGTKTAAGQYDPNTRNIWWSVKDSFGFLGINTMHHEFMHRIDYLLTNVRTQPHSITAENWSVALGSELVRTPITGDIKYRADSKLYQDSMALNAHLSGPSYQINKGYKYLIESFAEMGAHFNSLHRDYNGNSARINFVLSAEYPDLWRVFRDEVLPIISILGEKYAVRRQEVLDDYKIDDAQKLKIMLAAFGINKLPGAMIASAEFEDKILAYQDASRKLMPLRHPLDEHDDMDAYIDAISIILKSFSREEGAQDLEEITAEFIGEAQLIESAERDIQGYQSACEIQKKLFGKHISEHSENYTRLEAISIIKEGNLNDLQSMTAGLADESHNFVVFANSMDSLGGKLNQEYSQHVLAEIFLEHCVVEGDLKWLLQMPDYLGEYLQAAEITSSYRALGRTLEDINWLMGCCYNSYEDLEDRLLELELERGLFETELECCDTFSWCP